MLGSSPSVQFTDRHEYLQGPAFSRRARQSEHDLHKVIRARQAGTLLSPPAHQPRVMSAGENISPHFEIPWDKRIAPALHPESSDQKQERGCRSIKTPGRRGRGIRRTQSRIKKPQPVGLRKICLLNSTYPRKYVEICGQPAFILGQQFRYKRGGGLRARSYQILPCSLCRRSSGYDDSAPTDAEVSSVEIKHRGVGKQLSQPNRVLQRLAGFRLDSREGPIQPRHCRIVQECVQQVPAVFFEVLSARVGPVTFGEEYWHRGRGVRIFKGFTPLQRLLQFGKGEAGINRQKSPFGILCLQGHFGLATICPGSITENSEKRSCIVTIRNTNNHATAGSQLR